MCSLESASVGAEDAKLCLDAGAAAFAGCIRKGFPAIRLGRTISKAPSNAADKRILPFPSHGDCDGWILLEATHPQIRCTPATNPMS